jgi:hypothetical protein
VHNACAKNIEPAIIFRKYNEFLLLCFAYSSIIIWTVTVSYVSKSESVKLRFLRNTEKYNLRDNLRCLQEIKNVGKAIGTIARQDLCRVSRNRVRSESRCALRIRYVYFVQVCIDARGNNFQPIS